MTARLFIAPTGVEETLGVVSEHGRTGVIAGGTDAVVNHRSGKRQLPQALVSLHRVEELRAFLLATDGSVSAGALTTHSDIVNSAEISARLTALADASSIVGSRSTQEVGTIGGNLVNASPAMDTGSPLLVLGASAELCSSTRTRQLAIHDLWAGPGESVLADDEILARVMIPPAPPHSGSAYVRLEYRRAMEIAVVGVAAALALDDNGSVASATVALTAVGPTCFISHKAGLALIGQRPQGPALAEAARASADEARPITDNRASAAYRTQMVAVLTKRAITVAAARAAGLRIGVPASWHWRDVQSPLGGVS